MLVVLTGGAGFIGSATLDALAGSGAVRVLVVDDLSSGSMANIERHIRSGLAEMLVCDISAPGCPAELVARARDSRGDVAFIHLAALVGVPEARAYPERAWRSNVLGTAAMLEAARRLDASRFVYASSAAVYGEPVRLPVDEDHPLRPANLYGATKLAGENLLWGYSREYGLSAAALRYFNVYGPRMRPGPYSGVVYRFASALLAGEKPVLHGGGHQTRDFVYVSDVAEANVKALHSRYTGPLNVGSGTEVSILELLEAIARILGVRPSYTPAPPRPGDVSRIVADIRRAREAIGWEPRVPLEAGLRRTIEWIRQSRGLRGTH